jgi:hypothetical protein
MQKRIENASMATKNDLGENTAKAFRFTPKSHRALSGCSGVVLVRSNP